jgi:hypothetical protein
MDNQDKLKTNEATAKVKYEAPIVTVMDEAQVLTAFQVTAAGAGASMWWVE